MLSASDGRVPGARRGIVRTHFIVASDVDRTSQGFYADVSGGQVLRGGNVDRRGCGTG